MLANTVAIICHRLLQHNAARWQSRRFVRDAAAALRGVRPDEVISIAARNRRSHIATVVAAGLIAFFSTPPQITDIEAIEAAERAFRRSRKMFAADLKLGIGTLSTIASSAPFIGLLGTVFGIMNAFVGTTGPKSAALAFIMMTLSEALVTAAMGIAVAILAVWCRNYLCNRVAVLESEMSNAALEAVTYLTAHRHLRQQSELPAPGTTTPVVQLSQNPTARSWEVRYDRQWVLLLAMWSSMFYIVFILAQGMYESYIWQRSWDRSREQLAPILQQVGGQESISPDGRYRAMVPVIYREPLNSSGKDGFPRWSCGSNPTVALRIVPNDRPLAWKPHTCGEETTYVLEPDEALLTWTCSVPVVAWRSNDELLVQCNDCTSDNMQLARPGFFPRRITLLGADRQQIYPQVVHPQPQCSD
jgi:biopolymer transport protein ExbB/biopolymer transport protein TolQ